ncbi:MAG: hypothetical protein C4524_14695 [Candidatus Zixiibacteriota bacterium]|nr:MAG: hypothetical protein C4524_14695 [candidate division Zixibacteria bacterium]
MYRILMCLGAGLLLVAAAAAQAPNFDYGIFVTNTSGYVVNGNIYDIPTFGDWDADGDQDLMVGVFMNGNLYYYQNTAGAGNTPAFADYVVVQADGITISVTYG